MPILLTINSSSLKDRSVSREQTTSFIRHWTTSRAGGTFIHRELYGVRIKPISAGWTAAAFTPEASRTPRQMDLAPHMETIREPVRSSQGGQA